MSLGDDHGLDHGLAAGKQERAALVAQRSLPVPAVVGAPPLSLRCAASAAAASTAAASAAAASEMPEPSKVVELVKFSVKRGRPKRFM